jgi:hypothetical protein
MGPSLNSNYYGLNDVLTERIELAPTKRSARRERQDSPVSLFSKANGNAKR